MYFKFINYKVSIIIQCFSSLETKSATKTVKVPSHFWLNSQITLSIEDLE